MIGQDYTFHSAYKPGPGSIETVLNGTKDVEHVNLLLANGQRMLFKVIIRFIIFF